MRTSWLIGALVTFIIGIVLTRTIIGAIIGIPLIVISIILLLLAFIIPGKRRDIHITKEIHIHNDAKK